MRNRRLPLLLPLLVLFLACGGRDEAGLARLGELVAETPSPPLPVLDQRHLIPGTSVFLDVAIDTSRYDALELRARGSAPLLGVAWKLAAERRFQQFRRLDVSLLGDEEAMRTYRIDLGREAYWTGEVVSLALTADGGELAIESLAALPARDAYRDAALRGVSAPSLPGARRLEIPLPEAVPEQATFETMVGLLPLYDHPGKAVRFRAYLEGREDRPWIDEVVEGTGKVDGGEWLSIRRTVSVPRHARLVLETEAPEELFGGAMWADPLLSWGRASAAERNLVVVLVDTLRRDALGVYGDANGLTPRLDELASRSVRLDHLFAPAPWTLPSVASLMTGLHPQTHGAGRTVEGFAPTGLTDTPPTLAEALADAGFYTLGIYSNVYLNTAFGMQQGFDRYTILEERAEVLVDAALGALEEALDRRTFLFLHLFDPHNPYEPPALECETVSRRLAPDYAGDLGCHADRRPDLPLPARGDRPWFEALYRGEVAYTDRQIGRLLDGMEALGIADRTIVLVLSDHGEEFWRRQSQEEAYGYRIDGDHGHTLYRELLEVPGILFVPGGEPAMVRPAVEMVDLFPTLLSMLGVVPPPNQGRDLSTLLHGPPPAAPLLLFDRLLYGRQRWSILRGGYKLVVPHDGNGPAELFDVRADPGEIHNVAGDNAELVGDLRRAGERELAAREAARTSLLEGDSLSATYLEWRHVTRLRALGYLK